MAERNEKKKEKKKKKKYAEPEMGYCPLSIRQPGAGSAGAGARGRHGRDAGRRRARGLGVLLGQWAVLARFDSGLFLSRFLDIVREPGS